MDIELKNTLFQQILEKLKFTKKQTINCMLMKCKDIQGSS